MLRAQLSIITTIIFIYIYIQLSEVRNLPGRLFQSPDMKCTQNLCSELKMAVHMGKCNII